MILHNVDQGSPEWLALRLGIVTASNFDKILTPKGALSKSQTSRNFAYYLIAEKLLNAPLQPVDNLQWVERGKLLEPEAAKAYEFEFDVETEIVGFITTDDGMLGASPDRLVGANGLLEIKCPAPQTHIGYMLEGFGPSYYVQVQGQLMVAEREWVDRFSYYPDMPSHRERTLRDEPFIGALRHALDEFNDMKADMLERARAAGLFAAQERMQTQYDRLASEREHGPAMRKGIPEPGSADMAMSG